MDLSKAFDSVCHKKLINYLDKNGIKHKALGKSIQILFRTQNPQSQNRQYYKL